MAPGGVRGVSVARGVFRFISGPAGSGTHYIVKTPHASIAVRGTRFDVRVLAGMTTVVLDEGAVDVCMRGQCQAMMPGTSVDVTRAGIYPATKGAMLRWTFLTDAAAHAAKARRGRRGRSGPGPRRLRRHGPVEAGARRWGRRRFPLR